jgi:hypothetical protein
MVHRSGCFDILLAGALLVSLPSLALGQANPPAGYYDIPAGFDFPADKATLQNYVASGNFSAQRLHAWNVFAGMTQPTPRGYAVFETWYSEGEAFDPGGASPQAVGPRRVVREFRVPRQFLGRPGQPELEAAGSALLSEVMFNFANYDHIRKQSLYLVSELAQLQQTGAVDTVIPNNRIIPPFPADAISLKTIWWPVAHDKPTPKPVWDPEANPQLPSGNDYPTWKRVVAIDPVRTNIPPDATMDISFLGKGFAKSHLVGLDMFHSVEIDAQTAANAMNNGRLQSFVNAVLGRPLQDGDYVVFAATHMTTKEIDNWVWATFWWHDHPDAGPFAADRPSSVTGVWRNYLMSVSYDLNLPREADGKPHIAFNPYVEARFRNGILSNCMNCHNRAADPGPAAGFLPIMRGDPDLLHDDAFAAGNLRTDFLWSIPDNAQ